MPLPLPGRRTLAAFVVAAATTAGLVARERAGAEPGRAASSGADGPSAVLAGVPEEAQPAGPEPELPRSTPDVAMPRVTGRTVQLPAGGDLQAALDAARPGDEIVLRAGATYTGPFVLRNRGSAASWIVIRSSGTLPAAGTRVTPAVAGQMAKLVSRDAHTPVLSTAPGAHHYRIVGVEITAPPTARSAGALVALGGAGDEQRTVASQPHHLVLDRVYVHGHAELDFRRCVLLNSGETAIVDSWLSECHGRGADSQAIVGWNGTGPYLIANNQLEGAGENVMFGGADPRIPNALPADITIRGNHFFKPPRWRGVWTVKNSFELKLGRRVLVEGNVFENNWVDGQAGFAIVLKSTNQEGTAPWSQTADVTFRYNVVRNVSAGVSVDAKPEQLPAVPAARIALVHNLFERVGDGDYEGGRLWQFSGVDALTVSHNTGFGAAFNPVLFHGSPVRRLRMESNVFGTSPNALASADGKGIGTEALDNHAAPGWVFRGNVVVGARAAAFPTGNAYPGSAGELEFVNPAGGDYRLRSRSRFATAGVDRAPPGPDFTALARAIDGAVLAAAAGDPSRAGAR